MALTQIKTDGIADNAITTGKIPDGGIQPQDLQVGCVTNNGIQNEAVNEAKLQISNAGTNGQFLQKQSGNTGGLTWADGASEGTEVKSTGVSGTSSYLRADGDGTCSWQTVSAGTTLTGSTNNTVATVTGANAIAGEANLTFDGNKLTAITGSNDSRIIHSKNTTSDGALVHYTNSSTGHATGDGFITGIGSTDDGYIWHQESNHILFGTSNTERARLTSGGDFGVGTSTPNKSSVNAAVSVNGSSNSIFELCTGDARKGNIYTDGTDLYMTNNSTGWLGLHVKNNELAIKCLPDSGVELYYDGGSNKKLETVTGGVTITGTCTATTVSYTHLTLPTILLV